MFVYQDVVCPYCGQPLTPTDDLAVCPECGTPHHRSCYLEHGSCANADKHDTAFEWKLPVREAAPLQHEQQPQPESSALGAASAQRSCPNCGALANPADRFCLKCGTELTKMQPRPNFNTPGSMGSTNRPDMGTHQAPPVVYVQRLNMDERIDGIPIRDWLIYFGNSAFPFLNSFKRQDVTGRKTTFNFGAAIVPTLYFLYYKVWHIGALCALLLGILNTPSLLLTFFSGSKFIFGLPIATWKVISCVAGAVGLTFSVGIGCYANYLIRVDAGKKIRGMRRSCTNEQQYMELLNRKKCPSKLMIGLIIGYIAVLFIGLFF